MLFVFSVHCTIPSTTSYVTAMRGQRGGSSGHAPAGGGHPRDFLEAQKRGEAAVRSSPRAARHMPTASNFIQAVASVRPLPTITTHLQYSNQLVRRKHTSRLGSRQSRVLLAPRTCNVGQRGWANLQVGHPHRISLGKPPQVRCNEAEKTAEAQQATAL